MRNFFYLLLASAFFAGGCTEPNPTDGAPQESESVDGRRTVAQARAEVANLLEQIDGATRANETARKIADYYCCYENSGTRADQASDDEMLTYIFNFENNEGFAIVAADLRIQEPVLAITDKGYLDPEKGTDNPGLIMFLEMAENYCRNKVLESEDAGISTYELSAGGNWGPGSSNPWTVDQYYGERTYLNWNQWIPFNDNTPLINGKNPPLGCTATATMLLMAWHRYPKNYNGHWFNWTEMLKHKNTNTNGGSINENANSDLALLGEIITRQENLNMDFGMSGSTAFISNIPRTLEHLGFTHGGISGDWDKDIALKELTQTYYHYPVVVSAYETKVTYAAASQPMGINVTRTVSYKGGHTFLLENAVRMKRRIPISGSTSYYYWTLVYVNYGWSGDGNGYYDPGVFNKSAGPNFTRTTEGETDNFQYNMKMAYGARI